MARRVWVVVGQETERLLQRAAAVAWICSLEAEVSSDTGCPDQPGPAAWLVIPLVGTMPQPVRFSDLYSNRGGLKVA